ncbi:hypothetical protein NM09_03940 [Vibrio caribbeanicus]|uniref:Uncharacterized protein n=1 Tax=Vibrio caribbeanicus TaxID=701175 RepID=A0ACC4NZT3_9VIBR|nr:oligosaccharide flippase family protein [Vibrio caribbeanicus]KHD25912.1 hypothetical protein NM09_03940 [Vibrio caribbeanicus]
MKGLLWIFLERGGVTLLSFFATFWYAKLLGPEGYGIAALLLSVPLLISGFIDQVQQASLLANVRTNKNAYSTSFKYWAIISILICVVLYFILTFFFESQSSFILLIAVIHIPISACSKIFVSDLICRADYKSLAVRSFMGKIGGLIVGLTLAFYGYPIYAILLQSLVNLVLSLMIMVYRSHTLITRKSIMGANLNDFCNLIRDGIPSGVSVMEQHAKSHGLVIILGLSIGPYASGIYSLSNKIIDLVRVNIGHGFSTWSYGQFNRVLENGSSLFDVFKSTFFMATIVLVPSYVGLIIISSHIVEEYVGSQWEDAPLIISLISIIYLFMSFFIFLPSLQTLLKRTYNTLPINLFSTLIMLMFVIFFSSSIGILTPIYGMIISSIIVIPKYAAELRDILSCKLSIVAKIYSYSLFCALIMYVFSSHLEGGIIEVVFSSMFVYVLAYLFLYALKIMDRKIINKIIRYR